MTSSKGRERIEGERTGRARPASMPLLSALLLFLAAPSAAVEAQLGGRPAEDWALVLESGRRMATLDIANVVDSAGFREGEVVADIGAGTGIFSIPIARAVGSEGRVLAVEVDEGFMKFISDKAGAAGLGNVETVLGEFEDPLLPRRDIDAAFFHDVLHHIEDRPGYLARLAAYLAPASRIIVVDYRGEHPAAPHGAQPEMRIIQDEVTAWMEGIGFLLSREIPLFEEKFFVEYVRGGI